MFVGCSVGANVGPLVVPLVGAKVGLLVGPLVGPDVGLPVGPLVGASFLASKSLATTVGFASKRESVPPEASGGFVGDLVGIGDNVALEDIVGRAKRTPMTRVKRSNRTFGIDKIAFISVPQLLLFYDCQPGSSLACCVVESVLPRFMGL